MFFWYKKIMLYLHIPKDAQVLIPGMCDYMAKGTLQTWLNWGSRDGKMTLDYPRGSNVIARILTRKRQWCQGEKCDHVIRLAVREEPQVKKCEKLWVADKGKTRPFPKALLISDFSWVRPTKDFWSLKRVWAKTGHQQGCFQPLSL